MTALACPDCMQRPGEDQHDGHCSQCSNGSMPTDDAQGPAAALASSRVDLIDIIEHGIPDREFVPGTGGFLAAGKRHHIAAERKTGKSLGIGIVAALDIVFAGGVVYVLDRENGADEYARRLDAVLKARHADERLRDLIRQNFRYHAWPTLRLQWGTDPAYAAAFAGGGRRDLRQLPNVPHEREPERELKRRLRRVRRVAHRSADAGRDSNRRAGQLRA